MQQNKKSWTNLQVTLDKQILQSLYKNNFKQMLPVQQASIPLLLKNYDLAVQAQTGSGKTLAFLIPLLQKLFTINIQSLKKLIKINVKFVILSPTRQLCQQTYDVLQKLFSGINQKKQYFQYCYCVTGGKSKQQDYSRINNKALVLIGTIGRMKQLMEINDSNWLKKVDYLYIDQADRVIKQKGIQQLIKAFQKMRRTAMFSATLVGLQPKDYQFYGMRNLAKISLKSLTKQNNTNYNIPKSLTNTYLKFQNRQNKILFLINTLQILQKTQKKIIVFMNTCSSVDYYSKLINQYFKKYYYKQQDIIIGLHGKLKTKKRKNLLKCFINNKYRYLFTTDVVARGIDFDSIDYIIQIDPPQNPDNYIHRIGRTARINKPGTAILLLQNHQQTFIQYLKNKSVEINQVPINYFGQLNQTWQQLKQNIFNIILTDRDYIQKSKKAFVSYIRSYKEHILKYIFQFKNISIGNTANSFFLLRIPRIKQILGKKINYFQQSSINPQNILWINKNQQIQYLKKKQKLKQKKQQQQKQMRKIINKKQKLGNIKNNKSQRKRQKIKKQLNDLKQINKQHNQLKRQKKNNNKRNYQQMQVDQQLNTQQIENNIMKKYQ